MNAVAAIELITPDGVKRHLRCTPGAQKMILDRFQARSMEEILNKGDWALFEVAYAMMHDAKGEPPAGLTLAEFLNTAPLDAAPEVLAAVVAAISQGRKTKNELEALLAQQAGLTGSTTGASAPSASDSQTSNSGGATPSPRSTLASTGTRSNSGKKASASP